MDQDYPEYQYPYLRIDQLKINLLPNQNLLHLHLSIHKEISGGKTYTRVTPLDREARIDALARLQGGQANLQQLRERIKALRSES